MTRSFAYEFYLEHFSVDYIFWVFFIVIFLLSALAYELGFARKLPLLKSIIVYVMLLLGTFITTTFAVFQMPIIESLIIISLVLAIYRFRMYRERKRNN